MTEFERKKIEKMSTKEIENMMTMYANSSSTIFCSAITPRALKEELIRRREKKECLKNGRNKR